MPKYALEALPCPGVFRVRLPVDLPIHSVNCYLLRSVDGQWIIFDPGFYSEDCAAVWQAIMADLDIRADNILCLLLSHYHPDHAGMAGWFERLGGDFPSLISAEELPIYRRVWHSQNYQVEDTVAMLRHNGLPDDLCELARGQLLRTRRGVLIPKRLTPLAEGAVFETEAGTMRVLALPGHTEGQLGLLCAEQNLLLAADHLLAGITPNISYRAGSSTAALSSYLQSLESLSKLPGELVAYPGHGKPVIRAAERAAEIIAHHQRRLEHILSLCYGEHTAYALCGDVFTDLPPERTRFAMGELLAHVDYLAAQGLVRYNDGPQLRTICQA